MDAAQIAAGYLRQYPYVGTHDEPGPDEDHATHLLVYLPAGVRHTDEEIWAIYREVLEQAEDAVSPEDHFQILWWDGLMPRRSSKGHRTRWISARC